MKMARSARDKRLETRTARLNLKKRIWHYAVIGKGSALAYRRGFQGFGSWHLRSYLGNHDYEFELLGGADDFQDADGIKVLDFFLAMEKARTRVNEKVVNENKLTVAEAATKYMDWFRENRKSIHDTELVINAHILSIFGDREISELSSAEIRAWHEQLAKNPPRKRTKRGKNQAHFEKPHDVDGKRARKSTANRILTVLKAILNFAFKRDLVADDLAWRRVEPFGKVDEPRVRFLTAAESQRLINAAAPDFRELIQGALYTGARYGELVNMPVSDIHLDQRHVFIKESKGGKSRFVPLNDEGLNFFKQLVAGRSGGEVVFRKLNNQPWKKAHAQRPMDTACTIAKIKPAITFHELRHTYASIMAQAGADLLLISNLLGHADTRVTSRHYAHLCDKTLADAVQRFLPSFGFKPDKKVVAISDK
jgi:integrase